MTVTDTLQVDPNRRFQFNWLPDFLFHPRRAFEQLAGQARGLWVTPMLVFSLTTLAKVLVSGWLKSQATLAGEMVVPDVFQYYTPEQQAQFTQALQATQGPVFVYILPAILALVGIWVGWLLVGSLLHLLTTLLGGRGVTIISLNVVAWASLPFIVRDLVRIIAMLVSRELIAAPGVSGLLSSGEGGGMVFLSSLLGLVDIYLIWHILLVSLGVRVTNSLSTWKSFWAAFLTVLLVLLLQALVGFGAASLANMNVIRPFFF